MLNLWFKTVSHIPLEYVSKMQWPITEILCRKYSYKTVKRPDASKLRMPSQSTTGIPLKTIIAEKIKLSGGISVADYMNTILTNPSSGYYTTKDAIGASGDFITSPEISQLFGEILGLWFYNEWEKIGSPKPLQIVELGPGKGSLLVDLLRTIHQLGVKGTDISLHLVEISPTLQSIQANRFCLSHKSTAGDTPHYYEGETLADTLVYWYNDIQDVPKGFSWFIAHEFFDALPILKFKKTENGWRELKIDLDLSHKSSDKDDVKFRFFLSHDETTSSKLFLRPPLTDRRLEDLEVCPKAFKIGANLSERIERDGGICLITDYGHSGTKGDTFRAFRNHAEVDPLLEPGTADLTADVDFEQLKIAFNDNLVFGPVEQGDFLKRCHADIRLSILMDGANDEQKENLKSGYQLLTDKNKMGSRFKFLSVFPKVIKDHLEKFPVLGFSDNVQSKS